MERVNKIANSQEEANGITNEQTNENQIGKENTQQNITQQKNEQDNGQTGNTEILPDSPKTAEEKAIAIVKADYGEKDGITFRVEGMNNNGDYVVKVVNAETTAVLDYYYVNVTQGTFTK